MTAKDITPEVKSAVNTYLLARAYAEVQREKVDAIERRILQSEVWHEATEWSQMLHTEQRRITEPKDTFLLSDQDSKRYLLMVRAELEKAGYEIESTPGSEPHSYFCPALTAEHEQTKAEWLILGHAAKMMKMGFDGQELNSRLLCMKNGLEQREQFIDLVVKLVVNAPDFKNPLVKPAVGEGREKSPGQRSRRTSSPGCAR